jgi:hypothetical protein
MRAPSEATGMRSRAVPISRGYSSSRRVGRGNRQGPARDGRWPRCEAAPTGRRNSSPRRRISALGSFTSTEDGEPSPPTPTSTTISGSPAMNAPWSTDFLSRLGWLRADSRRTAPRRYRRTGSPPRGRGPRRRSPFVPFAVVGYSHPRRLAATAKQARSPLGHIDRAERMIPSMPAALRADGRLTAPRRAL